MYEAGVFVIDRHGWVEKLKRYFNVMLARLADWFRLVGLHLLRKKDDVKELFSFFAV